MPRSATTPFDYSLPPVYLAIPGTTIVVDQHNLPLQDIAATFNEATPVNFGGTGASTAAGARLALSVPTYVSSTTQIAALDPSKDLNVVLNANLIGGSFNLVTLASLSAAEQAAVAIDNAANRILYVVPSDDPTKVYKRTDFTGAISAYWAGAKFDGVNHDAAPINACIVLANALGPGAKVTLPQGTGIIEFTTTNHSASFGIFLLSNVRLEGMGQGTILKSAGPTTGNIIGTGGFGNAATTGIQVANLTFDGNQVNIPSPLVSGQASLWFVNSSQIAIENLYFTNAPQFNLRFDECNIVDGHNINIVSNSGRAATDSIHFYDTSNVNIDGIYSYNNGDDGIAINANTVAISNYNLTNVISLAPSISAAPGSCIVLRSVGGSRTASNINISATTGQAVSSGLLVAAITGTLTLIGCNFTISDSGSAYALNLSGVNVIVDGCEFDIKALNNTTESILMLNTSALTAKNNRLRAYVFNPPAAGDCCAVWGTGWDVDVQIDSNGQAPVVGVDIYCDHSRIKAVVSGAVNNIFMRSGASTNQIDLISTNAGTNDLTINSGANNNDITGSFPKAIANNGTGNKFYGGQSVEGYGTFVGTTDGSGNLNVPHGLIGTPSGHVVGLVGSTNVVNLTVANGTNLVVHVFNPSTLAAVTATGVTIAWQANI